MEVKEYFDIIEEIVKEAKRRKPCFELNEKIIICLIEEIAKDKRTSQISQFKSQESFKERGQSFSKALLDIPTQKQINFLQKLKVKNIDKLTKQEATEIIKEKILKQKEEKDVYL